MIGCENITSILDEPLSHNNTNVEYIIVGTIYMTISLLYLAPYIMCMSLIYTDKKLICKPYYMIVVHMGLTDIIQLVFNGIFAGLFTLCNDIYGTFWVNKFIGGLMNFCWVMYCCLAHLLALNRFVNLFWPLKINEVFSMKNTKILIGFIWAYGLSWFAAYMSPGFNLVYLRESFNWDYDENCTSRLGWLIELITDVVNAAFMVIWYALIFAKLKTKKLNNQGGAANRQNEYKKELKVLLQAFVICLMVIFTIIGFFCVPLVVDNKWATFASNLIWLGCAGNNAMVYYIFNSSIRKKALNVLRCKIGDPTGVNPLTGGDFFRHTRIDTQKQVDEENTIQTDSTKKETSNTERRDYKRKFRFSITSLRRISVAPK